MSFPSLGVKLCHYYNYALQYIKKQSKYKLRSALQLKACLYLCVSNFNKNKSDMIQNLTWAYINNTQ